jgi:hypothetical protein
VQEEELGPLALQLDHELGVDEGEELGQVVGELVGPALAPQREAAGRAGGDVVGGVGGGGALEMAVGVRDQAGGRGIAAFEGEAAAEQGEDETGQRAA